MNPARGRGRPGEPTRGWKPGASVSVRVTFLEMLAPPGTPPAPPAGAELRRVTEPNVGLYRELYDAVGRDWYWVERLRMEDGQLAALLGDDRVELYVLEAGGERAGFAELDRREARTVRLAYFGLLPAFIGRGLGRWFLRATVDRAWAAGGVDRLWVDTCTLDHPRALAGYEAAGFRVFRTLDKPFIIPW